MKKLILLTSVAVASGVLFANIFNSLVIAVATDSNIPNSIIAGKEFFRTVNPGAFFQIFSPASQILTLASLLLFWKHSKKNAALSGDRFGVLYFRRYYGVHVFSSQNRPYVFG